MVRENETVRDIKIAYIGGGSRAWARKLMGDLAQEKSMSGEVWLYDIDVEAARDNAEIGNGIMNVYPDATPWQYRASESLRETVENADFVVISILPGTFDEMESDVHAPEKYGIIQPVGDSVGPGGILRALRTVPMYVEFAEAIRDFAPHAWVINYTNPMTMCVRALYAVFPKIKAFGCCHEVFGTQQLLTEMLREFHGIEDVKRSDMKINVKGINHFTWVDSAYYGTIDLMPVYRKFTEKYSEIGYNPTNKKYDWSSPASGDNLHRVKMDLFKRYGYIAAAGDRHLSEFCPGAWYLASRECAYGWNVGLTPISLRKSDLQSSLDMTAALLRGEEKIELCPSGEEGVMQMKAILGLGDLVTNVNMPNVGQIPNMPRGMVVETNAYFTANKVQPVMAGDMPDGILGLTMQTATNQEMTVRAALTRDLDLAFAAFTKDNLMRISLSDARKLFRTMIENTKKYLPDYQL